MKEKERAAKGSHPELAAKVKEIFSKFEELRGFL